jgi:hypothetical protein
MITNRGMQPQLQLLDNEASTKLKNFMREKEVDFMVAPPNIHWRIKAERAICTFKNQLIAGLCSTDKTFPLHLWDELLLQALLTLNLLRTSRINPKLFAHAQMHGFLNFNKTPIATPGIRVLVHENPSMRGTWTPHAVDGWYLGPTIDHYRSYKVWIWEIKATRITDTLTWFPSKVKMPSASSTYESIAAAKDLTYCWIFYCIAPLRWVLEAIPLWECKLEEVIGRYRDRNKIR